MGRALNLIWRSLCVLLLVIALAFALTGFSPIFNFAPARPFSGPDIFNPYAGLDSANCWKRANFHTHTKVDGIFNECSHTPQETYDSLAAFGYDIVTFSNHNKLTVHPFDSSLQVNVYEHGYNLFKYHKLVFGAEKVLRYDNLLPILASQKQFQLDLLGRDSDFIQMNHPLRTGGTSESLFRKLSGYRIMELDSGISTEQPYWDWALSAGRYSFGLANDDLHYPDRSERIAVRCNFLCTPSGRYEDLKRTLLSGGYYSMRVPDYGSGDWRLKHEGNRKLPAIRHIGLEGNTICLKLDRQADSIRVTGQGGLTQMLVTNSCSLSYDFSPEDSYVRLTAFFPDGEVIYTNPFARYDAASGQSPYQEFGHSVNLPLTILYNLALLSLVLLIVYLIKITVRRKK